jgi:hypothetical protein
MKTIRYLILLTIILMLKQDGKTQGFINLNFESASLVPTGGFYVQFAPAFPGWTGTAGGVSLSNALYNVVYLDTAGISIIDHNWTNQFNGIPGGLIQGRYTAILQSGIVSLNTPGDTTLSQTGQVPVGTQSLLFEAYEFFDSTGAFGVTLGGQNLSLTVISNALNYTLYGADVSAWAGQTAQLAFTVFGENPHQNDEYLYLDAIQFSTQSIPEPGEFALAALGILLLGNRRWRQPPRP